MFTCTAIAGRWVCDKTTNTCRIFCRARYSHPKKERNKRREEKRDEKRREEMRREEKRRGEERRGEERREGKSQYT